MFYGVCYIRTSPLPASTRPIGRLSLRVSNGNIKEFSLSDFIDYNP